MFHALHEVSSGRNTGCHLLGESLKDIQWMEKRGRLDGQGRELSRLRVEESHGC